MECRCLIVQVVITIVLEVEMAPLIIVIVMITTFRVLQELEVEDKSLSEVLLLLQV